MYFIILFIFLCLAFLTLRINRSEKKLEKKIEILQDGLQQLTNKMAEDEEERKQRLLAKVRKYGIAPDDLRNINCC